MNLLSLPAPAPDVNDSDCRTTLARLVGNLSGFVYRRRHDRRWSMDFVSAGVCDLTGYDPHRFLAGGSIAFADLIAPADRDRVNETVRVAILRRRRAAVEYRIRTAYGAWIRVEDRFTPVMTPAGKLLAIEGVVDRVRWEPAAGRAAPSGPALPLPKLRELAHV